MSPNLRNLASKNLEVFLGVIQCCGHMSANVDMLDGGGRDIVGIGVSKEVGEEPDAIDSGREEKGS
jgi:hypothetical protein